MECGQNAYLSGKMGSSAALKNSSVAAYLTEEQRTVAYELGRQEEKGVENRGNNDKIKKDNVDVRKWYINRVNQIPDMVDPNAPKEQQARQAFEFRNQIRTEAREMMADQELRNQLEQMRPNVTFEELIDSKMKRKGLTKEEAVWDIYITATKTNENVNSELGLGGSR